MKGERKKAMAVKINKLELENVKRIKAVSLEPSSNGLTIIGGNNNQGKTSVLDSIAWALGGERFRPSQAERTGSNIQPYLKVILSNGLIVERKGKNSALKITDPSGQKAGQRLLDEFINTLALNLPQFMSMNNREKAKILLNIIGVGEQLITLEHREKELFDERRMIGRIADQKKKFADEQPFYPDMPPDLVSISDLIRQQQEILIRNGENQRKREQAKQLQEQVSRMSAEIMKMREELQKKEEQFEKVKSDMYIALTSAKDLQDESTVELEQNIAEIEETNRKIRVNLDKEKADEDAAYYHKQYESMTASIEEIRGKKAGLLQNAELPLPGLSVTDGELVYNGQKWDNMSGSDQLKISTAIVRKLNPECGFVLLDKLEQMDMRTLQEFGFWLEQEGLQAIATRVSTGSECSIIIEDGYSSSGILPEKIEKPVEKKKWKAGEF